MKISTLLATIVVTISSCNSQKKTNSKTVTKTTVATPKKELNTVTKNVAQIIVPTIYYEASTRGFFKALKVENQQLFISDQRGFKEYEQIIKISDSDWLTISSLAKSVDLDKVKDMHWPTEKRYFDGAAHANIIFESNGVKYPANGFDHGFPPAEVEKLVRIIIKLSGGK